MCILWRAYREFCAGARRPALWVSVYAIRCISIFAVLSCLCISDSVSSYVLVCLSVSVCRVVHTLCVYRCVHKFSVLHVIRVFSGAVTYIFHAVSAARLKVCVAITVLSDVFQRDDAISTILRIVSWITFYLRSVSVPWRASLLWKANCTANKLSTCCCMVLRERPMCTQQRHFARPYLIYIMPP